MNEQTIKLIFGAAAAVGVAIGAYYASRKYLPVVRERITHWLENDRHIIREQVNDWLHRNKLNKTALSDVVIKFDTVANYSNNILCKVYAKTKETGEVKISEKTMSIEELLKEDASVAEQVIQKIAKEETSIMSQVM